MQRIGEELLRQRKRVVLGEKVEVDKEIEKDTADLKGRDLLTVLVQANMDIEALHNDIRAALPTDESALSGLRLAQSDDHPQWSVDESGLLHYQGRIWVPASGDLRLRVLRNCHDHILAGHFGQNRTLALVRRTYAWPKMRDFVKRYVSSCTTCGRNKAPCHRPYGLLQPLPLFQQLCAQTARVLHQRTGLSGRQGFSEVGTFSSSPYAPARLVL